MTIIYNEDKAIRDKQRIDAEAPRQNRRAKLRNGVLLIVLIVLATAVVAGAWFGLHRCEMEVQGKVSIFILLIIVVAVVGLNIWSRNFEPMRTAAERYPANVWFYLATKDKRILKQLLDGKNISDIEPKICASFLSNFIIKLTLENKDHVVTTKEIRLPIWPTQFRTDITVPIVDLDKEIVMIPYNDQP